MAFWQITYNGVTRDAAAWGVSKLKRKRKSAETSTVKFSFDGTGVDSNPPFAIWSNIAILRNGRQWFFGSVTRILPKASGSKEAVDYEVSDPWYWLEKTVFQQQWVVSPNGVTQETSTRSNVILSQSFNGAKLSTGQVIIEALLYAQYAYQGQPYPETVVTPGPLPSYVLTTPIWSGLLNGLLVGLPAPPNPANGPLPFIIGAITPSLIIPFSQMKDKSCADVIRLMMKYSPDAVAWMDCTTSPPTVNIDRRSNLAGKRISVLNSVSTTPQVLVTGFNPTPRYDLQVPCVIAKFEETNTINGTGYLNTTVDQYPSGVPDNAPRAWVQTIDLVGGSVTSQSVKLTCRARPLAITDGQMMPWVFYKEPWLKIQAQAGGQPIYDYGNIGCVYINTVIDPNDPLNSSNPLNVPLPDCHTLVNELVTGHWADWISDVYDLSCAKVLVEVWLSYSGSDKGTQALFSYDPSNPGTALTDGTGYLIKYYNIRATNASTTTYTQVTSQQDSEPVPTGFAQYLYECMAPLHLEGDMTLTEQECSDVLPVGCVFNTTDGRAEWQTANMLVIEVSEDIDMGTTEVTFGPPLMLGLQELEELFRANYGLIPSYQLSDRTTGMSSSSATVTDPKHAGESGSTGPPTPGGGSTPGPFGITVTIAKSGLLTAVVTPGRLFTNKSQGTSIPISQIGPASIKVVGNDFVWIEGTVNNDGSVSSAAISSYGSGGNWVPSTDIQIGGTPSWLNYFGTYPNVTQTGFRILIGTLTASSNPKSAPSVQQNVTSDIAMISYTAFDGFNQAYPAVYPQGV